MIKVHDFAKSYRKKVALKGVSLTVESGQIYGLIGPDGAGKSSLLKAIAGVMTYDAGEVWVQGVHIHSEASAESVKQAMGFMPQGLGLNLYPELSVSENIDFFAQLRGVSASDLMSRKQQLLAMTQLSAFTERPMKFLSGGMKQKLGLVCTLIHRPKLVILDEPTTGVDPLSRRDFWRILNQLVQEEGITALVSTAYMDEASRFDALSILHQGEILSQGTASQILAQTPGLAIEMHFDDLNDEVQNALQAMPPIFSRLERLGHLWRGVVLGQDVESGLAPLKSLLKQPGLVKKNHFQEVPLTLEDVFIQRLQPAKNLAKFEFAQSCQATTHIGIQATALTKQFNQFVAADQVSFSVKSGEILGLLGANGAGKSTVIKMLTGILPATSGDTLVAGLSMATSAMAIKQQIGYVSQSFSLYLDLTVKENIQLFGRIYGLAGQTLKVRTAWVLHMAGLTDVASSLVKALPIGQRQRLALGCALIHEPKVLFLDEPTSGVDPLGRADFWRILVNLAEQMGVAILVTTHYMSEAEHCHQLVLMQAGRVVAYDSPLNLKKALAHKQGLAVLPSLEAVFVAQLEAQNATV